MSDDGNEDYDEEEQQEQRQHQQDSSGQVKRPHEDEDEEEEEEEDGEEEEEEDDEERDTSSSLESDDIDLIEENLGVRLDPKKKKKKYKRIKTVLDDDSDDDEADDGKKIQNELFGHSNLLDSDDEEVNRHKSKPVEDLEEELEDEESDDSNDGFIVDDNDQPIHKKTKKKGTKYTNSAMQEAQEIFGVDFDFEDPEEEDGYEDEGGYAENSEEEEEGMAPKKKKGTKTIYEVFEPAELARSHLTSFDQRVRSKDEPERFQLRSVPVSDATDEELEQEAEWIFQAAFDLPTISVQERNNDPIAGKRSEVIKPDIKYALSCIRNEKLEVSFIAAYRREYLESIVSNFDDTKVLWTIYRYDEQWCRLQTSKKSILNLYLGMRDYIESKTDDRKNRQVTDTDIELVHSIKNFHDLEDCRLHFQLYYSHMVTDMKLYVLDKKIKEKQAQKAASTEEGEEVETEETEEEKLYKRLAKFKISSRKDNYQRCREDGIGDLVAKFGLTPDQLGENLRDDYQRNNIAQCYTRPLDEAANFLKPGIRFTTRDDVLKAATYMFSREISCDPLVRKTIRKYYFENAVINVKPTAIGMKEIDENHSCFRFKFLKNKPAMRIQGEQFLHLLNAEKDKLIELHFSIEPIDSTDPKRTTMSPYYESLKALYYSDFSSIVTKEWNDQREEAVRAAMDKHLLPCIQKQLREKLVKEAQDKIMKDSCERLHHWLNVAPYAPSSAFDDHEDFELRNGTRICGFTFEPDGEAPCFAAIVDSEGELIDHVRLPYLNIRKRPDRMNHAERENHAKDRVKFKQFMINKKPHAVALAAETIQTQYICKVLATILDELHENDGLPLIPIEIVDNELSNVYVNTKRAADEFPDFPPLLLGAISNARKLNDPLSEYAKLCTSDNDITCIRFHTLQEDLPKEEFLERLYHEFVTRTNAVGVDPNRAIAHPHTSDLVQFVAGLGPRKGAHLLRLIKKSSTGGQLVSRQQLVKELGLTPIVFINCAGFIKLDTDTLGEYYPDDDITPLDSTRIHPQSYGLAKKIASDALDYDEGASDDITAKSIEEILECTEKLDDLDLNAFARELDEVQNQGKKGNTLHSIRDEFQCRYRDHREAYKAPSQEEIFAMLTKETPYTFYNGKLVTCRVVAIPRKELRDGEYNPRDPIRVEETNSWRCPFCMRSDFQDLSHVWEHQDVKNECPGYGIGIRCKLDNGLIGFIHNRNISDKEILDPSERVAIGQTIYARVIKIDTDKFGCDLTCKTSDLIDEAGKWKLAKDDYYDEGAEKNAKIELENKSRKLPRKPFTKRLISHENFKNINYKDCLKLLETKKMGDVIFRPSSAGPNYLTASWKVTDDIIQHISIREEEKDYAFSLGHQLYIDNVAYDELDEIISRHFYSMNSLVEELFKNKYFLRLPPDVDEVNFLQETLYTAMRDNPRNSSYRFCPSRKMPGKFLLGYLPGSKVRIEYLTVTPTGFRFRKMYFQNLVSLVKWFKENWNKVPQVYPTPAVTYQ